MSFPSRHPLETLLAKGPVRRVLGAITRPGTNGTRASLFERFCEHYHDGTLQGMDRAKWLLPTVAVDLVIKATGGNRELLERKLFHHRITVCMLNIAARSIARYGLSQPQRFDAPMLVVWNITELCNLRCRHCYQESEARRHRNELSRVEKLAVVDQMAAAGLPLLAIAGGEPLACPDLIPVIERATSHGIYVMVASNGTLVTEDAARQLKRVGVEYLEISVDSADPAEHDGFRGHEGSWARAVAGILNARKAGLDVGLATCLTSRNAERVDDLVQLARDLDCETFSHFNFIPVGRGREMFEEDLDPAVREAVLVRLNEHLQQKRIKVISTAPQLARACVVYGTYDGLFAQGHGGRGQGPAARVLSKYVGGCGAGRCYCALQPDGTVTPCVYMRSWPVGNIRERPLGEIWDNDLFALLSDRSKRTGHCAECEFRSYCGGCRARAAAYTGDPTASDPGCIKNAGLWQELKRSTVEASPPA